MFAEHQESKGVSCSQLSGGFHFSGNLPAAQQRLLWKTNVFLQLRDRTPGWAERKELSIDVGLQGLQSERSARVPLVQRSMLNQHHAGLVSCRSTRYHCLFHRYIDRSLLIPQEFPSGNEGLVLNNNWDPAPSRLLSVSEVFYLISRESKSLLVELFPKRRAVHNEMCAVVCCKRLHTSVSDDIGIRNEVFRQYRWIRYRTLLMSKSSSKCFISRHWVSVAF